MALESNPGSECIRLIHTHTHRGREIEREREREREGGGEINYTGSSHKLRVVKSPSTFKGFSLLSL